MTGRENRPSRTVLENILRQYDRTYEEIAKDFEQLAVRLNERGVTISAQHLRRLASGDREMASPATKRVLEAFFGMPARDLLAPWNPSISPLSGSTSPSSSDLELLTMAAERSRTFITRKNVLAGGETIEQIADEVGELARIYPVTPLPMLLGRLVDAQDSILSLLELRQKPANAQQLYFLASLVAGMLAYAGNDVGKPQIALAHARSAFTWAEYSDHNGMRAWIRGLQSFVCYWADRPHDSIRYAQSGEEFARAAKSSAGVWLFSGEARAWAALGDADKAKSLILQAERVRESARPDDLDEFGGICTFGESRQLYYAGRALACLPSEGEAAERYSIQAVEAYSDPQQPEWDFTCQADSRISLALARSLNGEIDGVSEALQDVFSLAPEQRINDLVKTIGLVHRSLNRFTDQAEARDIQEQIEVFTRTSLPLFPI
ncbi:hypothetical protein Ga0074812_104306 [Parafrankia irregularis]|uniref:XRE family transcriptional regulator n=1 Tax=Parafrankia irregularis TaxID=795642 RepID=A0A0S4QJ08_9ACTN|nr:MULTISPECIES: XRE family transcriptional regulator [Parafrankia]MBE3203902.1 XRE family transcriptional regulator [Parafrankia sp. CH37]CUU55225.1 hypothetical protein Ga0074812_104306 [Parafrankia irregularis]